jgi:predicted dehydrogenase
MQRREFIKQTTAAISITAVSARRVIGANDRVVIGLIGCGGRGLDVARLIMKEIHAVHIATPDHWHAIPTVMACEAGKDVYVEKPLAHNVKEGRAMVAAARKHNRIVQTGTQHRSAPHYREVERIIKSGELGEVRLVRVWNYSNLTPDGIGRPTEVPPEGLDWDFYLGPAPKVPFNRARFLGTFRWFWDYAGGTLTDFGTHRFDTVHQVMGVEAPISVSASGGRFSLKDAGEMPDVLQVTYEYEGFILSYEACNLNAHGLGGRTPEMSYYQMRGKDDRPHGEAYYGTNGALFADRIGFEIYPEPTGSLEPRAKEAGPSKITGWKRSARNRRTPPTCTSPTSSNACARAKRRMQTSRSVIAQPLFPISATSRTRRSENSCGTRRKKISQTTRRRRSCSAAKRASPGI